MAIVPVPKFADFRNALSVQDLAARASSIVRDLVTWASGQPRLHIRQLEIRGGQLPVRVLVPGLVRPPAGVVLLGCQPSSNPALVVDAGNPHWLWMPDGQVQISAISGLAAGTAYKLAICVVEVV